MSRLKFFRLFIVSLLLFSSCAPAQTGTTTDGQKVLHSGIAPTVSPFKPEGADGQWDLVFADEFNGPALDKSRWTTCYWWDQHGCTIVTNNELEWYQPGNVSIQDGKLVLQAMRQDVQGLDGKTYPYTSGMVSSGRASSDLSQSPGFAFQYGFAEIRARIPQGKGLWPAFWMLPITHQSKPEIDVMEILGDNTKQTHMNYHYVGFNQEEADASAKWDGPDFSQDWHTFGVDWEPDQITWYVDGVVRFKFTEASYIPAEPMYLLLNLAVGGDWPGNPDGSTAFPSNYEVDYLRVYQHTDSVHIYLPTDSRPSNLPVETIYLEPVADTYVDASEPAQNYATANAIYSDGDPVKIAFLKYNTTSLAGRKVLSAFLRIHTTDDVGSPSDDKHLISIMNLSDWLETQLTYKNRPKTSNSIIGSIDNATSVDSAYQIPLDVDLPQPYVGTVFSLNISSTGSDGLYLFTRESSGESVQLVFTLAK